VTVAHSLHTTVLRHLVIDGKQRDPIDGLQPLSDVLYFDGGRGHGGG
jgi:hypothetical protein